MVEGTTIAATNHTPVVIVDHSNNNSTEPLERKQQVQQPKQPSSVTSTMDSSADSPLTGARTGRSSTISTQPLPLPSSKVQNYNQNSPLGTVRPNPTVQNTTTVTTTTTATTTASNNRNNNYKTNNSDGTEQLQEQQSSSLVMNSGISNSNSNSATFLAVEILSEANLTNNNTNSGNRSVKSQKSTKSHKSTKGNISNCGIPRPPPSSSFSNNMIHQNINNTTTAPIPIMTTLRNNNNNNNSAVAATAMEQEQALFEQRLLLDPMGVAVRKINQSGKSSLRHVRCVLVDASSDQSVGNRSVGSWRIRQPFLSNSKYTHNNHPAHPPQLGRALVWGKKKDAPVFLSNFIAVRKGKTTERANKSTAPASLILSLITNSDTGLDIETPTELDREKFARAFARFLNVPLQEEDEKIGRNTVAVGRAMSVSSDWQPPPQQLVGRISSPLAADLVPPPPHDQQQILSPSNKSKGGDILHPSSSGNNLSQIVMKAPPPLALASSKSLPEDSAFHNNNNNNNGRSSTYSSQKQPQQPPVNPTATIEGSFYPPPLPPVPMGHTNSHHSSTNRSSGRQSSTNCSSSFEEQHLKTLQQDQPATAVVSMVPSTALKQQLNDENQDGDNKDQYSQVSSLTGHGYDQELVEELHNALHELRTELEESREEAARAVKVAEQAIQSAERSNSVEWQNTVTHKAAEAAALAQKRSAQAMAKQRLAEERLDSEKRAASFWRQQAEVAEEEAGILQTRAAAAEVQRAAVEEQLLGERRLLREHFASFQLKLNATEVSQREALDSANARNQALQMELEATRRELQQLRQQQQQTEADDSDKSNHHHTSRRMRLLGRKKSKIIGSSSHDGTVSGDSEFRYSTTGLLSSSSTSDVLYSDSNPFISENDGYATTGTANTGETNCTMEQLRKILAEAHWLRQQFELLKRATADDLQHLPQSAREWGNEVVHMLRHSQSEVKRLQARLAMENASRRKLLNEVQDLRGAVRVYCRPQLGSDVSLPSQDTLLLRCGDLPVSFEFDRVFDPEALQHEVYSEMEDVCLSVLDGYNICLMVLGPSESGKTSTILGDVRGNGRGGCEIVNHGIQLRAMKQLFAIASQRSERFNDTFELTIAEVRNERIHDLVAATETGERTGKVVIADSNKKMLRKNSNVAGGSNKVSTEGGTTVGGDDASSGKPSKLEIRTGIHGETVVQGLVSVEVNSFEQACQIWEECLSTRVRRLEEQGIKVLSLSSSSHIIATLKVTSANIATGIGTVGKIMFADLASADMMPRQSSSDNESSPPTAAHNEWRFAHKSLETLSECVEARIQFNRSVPYRNSTLTHLLRDCLESDTKMVVIACVKDNDVQQHPTTASLLKFATRMRRVPIGKATKHLLSQP